MKLLNLMQWIRIDLFETCYNFFFQEYTSILVFLNLYYFTQCIPEASRYMTSGTVKLTFVIDIFFALGYLGQLPFEINSFTHNKRHSLSAIDNCPAFTVHTTKRLKFHDTILTAYDIIRIPIRV